MKISKIGWIPKGERFIIKIDEFDDAIKIPTIYGILGTKAKWASECWPPRKVKITIEDMK